MQAWQALCLLRRWSQALPVPTWQEAKLYHRECVVSWDGEGGSFARDRLDLHRHPYVAGVDKEAVEDLKTKVTVYENLLESKESKTAESKAARQELGEIFDQADEILSEELDNMIELIKDSDQDFYNKYQAARVIKDI